MNTHGNDLLLYVCTTSTVNGWLLYILNLPFPNTVYTVIVALLLCRSRSILNEYRQSAAYSSYKILTLTYYYETMSSFYYETMSSFREPFVSPQRPFSS